MVFCRDADIVFPNHQQVRFKIRTRAALLLPFRTVYCVCVQPWAEVYGPHAHRKEKLNLCTGKFAIPSLDCSQRKLPLSRNSWSWRPEPREKSCVRSKIESLRTYTHCPEQNILYLCAININSSANYSETIECVVRFWGLPAFKAVTKFRVQRLLHA